MKEDILIYEMILHNRNAAKVLLEDYGEIYPLCCVREIESENSTTVTAYFEKETPTSIEVINHLIAAINSDIYRGKLLGACICMNIEEIQSQRTGLAFWINVIGFSGLKVTWYYELKDGKIDFTDVEEKEGIIFLHQ